MTLLTVEFVPSDVALTEFVPLAFAVVLWLPLLQIVKQSRDVCRVGRMTYDADAGNENGQEAQVTGTWAALCHER